jgi:pyruvate dehydrogenase E2 component (dihydrolipoamide acetyltransferase)
MAVEVLMPKFGLTMHEGTIQRFFKQAGASIRAGEPLYEVETEKVLYEVEAPASGTLAVTLFGPDDTVECGRVVAVIAEPGEDAGALVAKYRATSISKSGAPPDLRLEPDAPETSASPPPSAGRRAVSPIARKLAGELGVDLDGLIGTGPGGRITREDVERAPRSGSAASSGPAPSGAESEMARARSPGAGTADRAARTIPLRGMRKTIADRMLQSLHQSAQLTISTEADVTAAVELRSRLKRDFDLTYTDLIIHAAARALLRHPRINSRLGAEGIELLTDVNVGVAVALDDGLIVPVIRQASKKSLREIAAESSALGAKAHAGQLKVEDVSGGTFTISNLGSYAIDAFTPILNPGETAILGVGRIIEKPALYGGEITRRSMITLSLTFDHRVVDGAPAAAFLQTIVDIVNFGER